MNDESIVDALEEMEYYFPEFVIWNGTIYPVIASARRLGGKLEAGGFAMDADATFSLRQNLFSALPQKKQTINFQRNNSSGEVVESVRYQVDQVLSLPGGDVVRLVCVAFGKGV